MLPKGACEDIDNHLGLIIRAWEEISNSSYLHTLDLLKIFGDSQVS